MTQELEQVDYWKQQFANFKQATGRDAENACEVMCYFAQYSGRSLQQDILGFKIV